MEDMFGSSLGVFTGRCPTDSCPQLFIVDSRVTVHVGNDSSFYFGGRRRDSLELSNGGDATTSFAQSTHTKLCGQHTQSDLELPPLALIYLLKPDSITTADRSCASIFDDIIDNFPPPHSHDSFNGSNSERTPSEYQCLQLADITVENDDVNDGNGNGAGDEICCELEDDNSVDSHSNSHSASMISLQEIHDLYAMDFSTVEAFDLTLDDTDKPNYDSRVPTPHHSDEKESKFAFDDSALAEMDANIITLSSLPSAAPSISDHTLTHSHTFQPNCPCNDNNATSKKVFCFHNAPQSPHSIMSSPVLLHILDLIDCGDSNSPYH